MSAPTLPDALQSHRQRVVPSSPWFPHGTKIAAKAKHSFGSERFRVEPTAKTNQMGKLLAFSGGGVLGVVDPTASPGDA